jgi:hypothetical protein
VRASPISPSLLVAHIADAIDALPRDRRLAVAIDGAPPTHPDQLAQPLAEELRLRGRPAIRISTRDFLRPASLRLELGREDPDLFYTDWLDVKAIDREALNGTGQVLPRLWDPEADRAYRAEYVELPPGGAVLLEGAFLIGAGLDFDLTVHLAMSPAALSRHTSADEAWTLPAYQRYAEEMDPLNTADIAVRCDDPRHPALVTRE